MSSQEGSPSGSRSNVLGKQQVIPLPDGGFVVGWTITSFNILFGTTDSLWLQRFDAQAQPVGRLVAAGSFLGLQYELAPDRLAGFTLHPSSVNSRNEPLSSSTHFDADMVAQPGSWFGEARRELADGTYVLVSRTGATSFSVQRFSATGALLGTPFDIQVTPPPFQTASFQIAALLTEPGFALAWTAQSATDDSDVFTQAFVERERDRKKACREAAKAQKLRGKQRQAFIEDCLA